MTKNIDLNPSGLDAYTQMQTISHGITFILRKVKDKRVSNKIRNFFTTSQNKNSDTQIIFNFNEKKKKFDSTTYKPIKKCDKVKNYIEISATEYKINSNNDDSKSIHVLLFYANNDITSSKFKRFVNEYIGKKFDVIMGFHNVYEKYTFFNTDDEKQEVFFFRPPVKNNNLLGLFTYSSPDNINVGGKRKRIKKTTRKSKSKKHHKKYKKSNKNKTKKYRRN